MRIFYASGTTPNADVRSNLWRSNLYLPLVDSGHDVVEFDFPWGDTFHFLDAREPAHKEFIETNRPRVIEALLRQIRDAHKAKPVDLFFSYFYDACVLPEALDEIRRLGIVTVNWFCNGSYQLHLVSEIAPHYDWCLVPEKFRLKDYTAMGARPIYCQEAANPNVYKPHDLPQEFDVTFVGQKYGDRPWHIRQLLDAGVDVRVWGPHWPPGKPPPLLKRLERKARHWLRGTRTASIELPAERCGPPLSDEAMIQMYSRSRINLGFSSCGETHRTAERILQVRLRDFEVPMSGGFYLVEYMEELEEFFDIGKEVVCYRDATDLVEKVKYYLKHDAERESIRRSGHERCLRDHTWHKRFETAFEQIGLLKQPRSNPPLAV